MKIKKKKKPKPNPKPYLWPSMLLFAFMMGLSKVQAATDPIRFEFGGGHAFLLPLQNVNATQLYSFENGKGYPAVESVLYSSPSRRIQATGGAAAELGTSHAVPFIGLQARLSPKFFDTSNNDLFFGIAIAKHPQVEDGSEENKVEVTLKASIPLW